MKFEDVLMEPLETAWETWKQFSLRSAPLSARFYCIPVIQWQWSANESGMSTKEEDREGVYKS